jgi:hypothetical protein
MALVKVFLASRICTERNVNQQSAQGNQEAGEARRRTARGLTALIFAALALPHRQRVAHHDIIHLIRINTDSEINAVVKPDGLA